MILSMLHIGIEIRLRNRMTKISIKIRKKELTAFIAIIDEFPKFRTWKNGDLRVEFRRTKMIFERLCDAYYSKHNSNKTAMSIFINEKEYQQVDNPIPRAGA